jgi:hypothetical protein
MATTTYPLPFRHVLATVYATAQRTASHAIDADPKDLNSPIAFNTTKAFTQQPS